MITELTPESLISTITSSTKILVDFYAKWCFPCKRLHPTLEIVSNDFPIAAYDVDQDLSLASQFGIKSAPTLILYVSGREAGRIHGVVSEQELRDFLSV